MSRPRMVRTRAFVENLSEEDSHHATCFLTVKLVAGATLLTCLAPPTQVNADPPSYRIFYLGRLGTGNSEAFGLNDQGAVVGQSNVKAFVYVFTPAHGFTPLTITQIATNNFDSKANDINNAGQAVGQGKQSSSDDPEAYLWSLASGAVTDTPLGILDGGLSSEAFQVNDASPAVAVGTSQGTVPECLDPSNLPVKIVLDGMPALDILGSASSQLDAGAFGIDNGSTPRIVGTRNPDPEECVLATACGADDHNDGVQWQGTGSTTLGEYPSTSNLRHEGHDVNDQGQIVGDGFEDSDPGPFLVCRRDSLFWASSTAAPVRLVPDVSTDHAFARAIRNQLASNEVQVVGLNTTAERALLWIRSGTTWTTYKLIDRLIQTNGWTSLRDAADINECGWIAGFGLHSSGIRAYLLVPTVASCFADLNGDCKVNGFDLALLLGDDDNPDCATHTCLGDLDWTNGPEVDDTVGDVDSYDLAVLLGAWTGANLCSEECVEGWGGCGSAGGGESAFSDGGTNPTLIAQLIVQLIGLGYVNEAATLAELTGWEGP